MIVRSQGQISLEDHELPFSQEKISASHIYLLPRTIFDTRKHKDQKRYHNFPQEVNSLLKRKEMQYIK